MNKWPRKKIPGAQWISIFLWLAGIEGLLAVIFIALIPGDEKNQFLLGYSLLRIIIMSAVFALAVGLIYLGIRNWKFEQTAKQIQKLLDKRICLILFSLGVFIGWMAIWTPVYRLGILGAFFQRIFPVLVWLLIALFPFWIRTLIIQFSWKGNALLHEWRTQRRMVVLSAVIFLVGLIFWLFIFMSGWGITIDFLYWGGAAVPVLALQVTMALFLAGVGAYVLRKVNHGKVDWILFAVIWGIAALIWTQTPLSRNFFTPDPIAPNYEYYPYSDARYYDTIAQTALIGEGFMNHGPIQRPLYASFLVLFHLIAGQNVQNVANIQTIVFAIYPALLYIFGKRFFSRTLGIFLAVIAIFAGWGGMIVSAWIESAHVKLFLTDFPTAIFALLFTMAAFEWLTAYREGKQALLPLFIAGGIAGLGLLLRLNLLFLPPLALALGLWIMRRDLKRWLGAVFIMAVMMFFIALPWMVRNSIYLGSFEFDAFKVQQVVATRYEPTTIPTIVTPPANQPEQIVTKPVEAVVPNPVVQATSQPLVESNPAQTPEFVHKVWKVFQFTMKHFLHNEVMGILSLPVTPVYDDYRTVILNNSFLGKNEIWDGQLTPLAVGMTLLNLLIVSIGIAVSVRRWGMVAWLPFMVQVGYALSNGLARVSGWRYVQPVVWVMWLYFGLGLFEIIRWMSLSFKSNVFEERVELSNAAKFSGWKLGGIVLAFLLLGIFPVCLENVIPVTYPHVPAEETLDSLRSMGKISSQDVDTTYALLQSGSGKLLIGRGLYPEYYDVVNENTYENFGLSKNYMHFISINNEKTYDVILVSSQYPEYLPNGSDMFVFGCLRNFQGNEYLDALWILVDGEYLYRQDSVLEWNCP